MEKTRGISSRRSREFGKGFIELGNLALSGSVFVQFLPGSGFSVRALVLGVVTFAVLYAIAYYLLGGEN